MTDFIQKIINHNGRICSDGIKLSDGQFFRAEIISEKDGFFAVDFKYEHNDWDQWIKVEIEGEKGERVEYSPSLPGKQKSNTVILRLFKGVNTISITHLIGHELKISDISVSGKKVLPESVITPSSDYFYIDKLTDCRIFLLGYKGEPIAVKFGDIPIDFEVKICRFDETDDIYYSGDSLIRRYICIAKETLTELGIGDHTFKICFSDGSQLEYKLHIRRKEEECKLKIVSLDVGHGNASLICLPNGKNLMIDSGYALRSRDVIFNYLEEHMLKIDYYLLTHFHGDHNGMLEELIEKYSLNCPQRDIAEKNINADFKERVKYLSEFSYLDSTMLCRYDKLHEIWDLCGAEITVLNSRFDENGNPLNIQNNPDIVYNEYNYENSTSVSLLLRYNGFGYYHGADNYSYSQRSFLSK